MTILETEADYYAWLNDALPGDRAEYHRGDLAMSRGKGERTPLADLVWREQERGAVTLTQRREGPHLHVYLVECCKRPVARRMAA